MGLLLREQEIEATAHLSEGGRTTQAKGNPLRHLWRVCGQRLRGVPRTPAEFDKSLQLLSVMRNLGWHKSVRARRSVDEQGVAIPWYTYAAVEWLAPRVRPTDKVFEYGAGHSTVWFARRANQVMSVEHNSKWLDQVQNMVGDNVTFLSRCVTWGEGVGRSDSPYVAVLAEFAPQTFDIIVIDGEERVACAEIAPTRLRPEGIIIFDDSDRPAYRRGLESLHRRGFGRIDFYGFESQVGARKCTSIFSRFSTRWTDNNVPLVFQGW